RYVACNDGRGFSCGVVILCGGARFRSLGLAAEKRLRGRGVIDCTPCDAGFYVGKSVVVVGSGEYALRDARYLSKMGVHVTLLSEPETRVEAIVGDERLERIVYDSGSQQEIAAAGIAVRIGLEPNTDWLADLVELDAERRIPIDDRTQT